MQQTQSQTLSGKNTRLHIVFEVEKRGVEAARAGWLELGEPGRKKAVVIDPNPPQLSPSLDSWPAEVPKLPPVQTE